MSRFGKVIDELDDLFGMLKEAWRMGEKMGRNGDSEESDRAAAAERGQAIMKDIMEGIEQATALSAILEDVGKAVSKVAGKHARKNGDLDAEEFVKAGFDALEPKGDDDDDLRVGLQWLVIACSGAGQGGDDEVEEEEEEDERPRKKRPKWSRER